MTGKTYLRSSEVAALLRVTSRTVWRIPAEDLRYTLTPGLQRRYDRTDVEAYLARLNGQA